MKKLTLFLIFNFILLTLFAQTPNAFKYQTVVRNATGTVLNNQNVDFQISIIETSASGSAVYVETFSTTTNQFGLVNLDIGKGTVASGVFSTINWAGDIHFVKVETDIFDGNGLQNMGTSQLLSVPYALNAKSAENVFSGDYNALTNKPILTGDVTGATGTTKVEKIQGLEVSINTPANGQVLKWDSIQSKWIPNDDALGAAGSTDGVVSSMGVTGSVTKTITLNRTNGLGQLTASFVDSVNDADADATNELQTLNQTGATVTLSNGGGSISVADNDNNSSNELQTLNQTGTTVTLSNSGGSISVADNDNDSSNELQTISKLGSTVTLSNGGGNYIDAVDDADADTTNEIQDLQLTGNTLKITNNGSATNIDLSGYTNLWQENSNDIYYNGGNVGVGINNPSGKLIVKADASMHMDTAIFEVKNKNGKTIFAVYEEGVRIYVDDSGTKSNSSKAGFAVGGFNATKSLTNNYFIVSPDSIRAYIESNSGSGSSKAGFAVGGFNATKSFTHEYLRVTDDSTRIWTEDSIAGFGVRDLNGNGETSYMQLNPQNYFIGENSGINLTSGLYNCTYGLRTGQDLTSGDNNVLIGYYAGDSITTGDDNVLLGYKAGVSTKTGNKNIFIGKESGFKNISGSHNLFMGANSGNENKTGYENIFFGNRAGYYNTSGNQNVFLGSDAGFANQTGNKNTFLGFVAGAGNIDGDKNTVIGHYSGFYADLKDRNVLVGAYSGYNADTAADNVYIGPYSGNSANASNSSVAIGYKSGYNNNGNDNIFIGSNSGYKTEFANDNIFIGNSAGYENVSGNNLLFIGDSAGYNNTANYNMFIGLKAGETNTTGYSNTFIGRQSGKDNVSGFDNVFVGDEAGNTNLTGNNLTLVGRNAQAFSNVFNSVALGANSSVNADNQVRIGNTAVTSIGGYAAWTDLSDKRFKTNIKEDVKGLGFIMKLKPVTYKIELNKLNEFLGLKNVEINKEKANTVYTGFLAQDVEVAAKEAGFNFSGVDKPTSNKDHYGLRYSTFVVPLVKAVQEQQEVITKLNSEVDILKIEVEQLKQLLKSEINK